MERAPVHAAEAWGRSQGCVEFASDPTPGNLGSLRGHLACGFEEVGRTICFPKPLEDRRKAPTPRRGAGSGLATRPSPS